MSNHCVYNLLEQNLMQKLSAQVLTFVFNECQTLTSFKFKARVSPTTHAFLKYLVTTFTETNTGK